MRPDMEFDVAIIGGSIAGASTALRCAEAGLRVLLLDKSSFPRHKACGEGLSYRGRRLLDELPLEYSFDQLPHAPLFGYEISRGASTHALPTKIQRLPELYGVSRFHLDNLLFVSARKHPTITVYAECRVNHIEIRNDLLEFCTSEGTFHSRYAVLADGAKSPSAKILQPNLTPATHRTRFGYSRSYRGQFARPMDRVGLLITDTYQVYCTPTGETNLSICILADVSQTDILSSQSKREKAVQQAIARCGFVAEELVFKQGIGPVDCIRRPAYLHERVLLVGDACEQLDPVGGMGMTHALISSKLAAEALSAVLSEGKAAKIAFNNYALQRERETRLLRGFARLCYTNFVHLGSSRIAESFEQLADYFDVSAVVHARTSQCTAATYCASLLLSIFGASI